MKSQLFVPKKLKVGYQHRSGTYTKKLAYIIYWDNKGILRKEDGWLKWCHNKPKNSYYDSDLKKYIDNAKPISPNDYDNIPLDGFVLNKGAGGKAGSSSSWNVRQEYIRIYDPRDFEFEITVKNLLFILQHTDCSRGKGLEGKFVYAWDGKDLVLLPENCEEYQQSMGYTDLQSGKVASKELIEGAIYQTKKQEKLIYLGKFDYWSIGIKHEYADKQRSKIITIEDTIAHFKPHLFKNVNSVGETYETLISLSTMGSIIDETPVTNYAELVQEFNSSKFNPKIDEITFRDITPSSTEHKPGYYSNSKDVILIDFPYLKKISDNLYNIYEITGIFEETISGWRYSREYKIKNFKLKIKEQVSFDNNIPKIKKLKTPIIDEKIYSISEIDAMEFITPMVNITGKPLLKLKL